MQRLWSGSVAAGGDEEGSDGVRVDKENDRWLAVTVAVSGWIEKVEDYVVPWSTLGCR